MNLKPDVIKAIRETRNELSPFLEQLDFRVFSKYNVGYLRYQKDPSTYFIDLEVSRFLHTANYICTNFHRSTRILDIGIFIPVLPMALSKLGFQVDAIEKLSLYENTLDPILNHITKRYNIKIYDTDIINGDLSVINNHFDIVLLMAILEHLNGSPKRLLDKCRNFLKPSGYLFADVPNIASMPKRISFLLKGTPPLPIYSDYFLSDYPFEGHNREYSFNELQFALKSTGFEIHKADFLDARLPPNAKIQTRFINAINRLGPKSWRDVIWTVSKRIG
jgi:2-polyprenyl-3-methyl-5-hydroxy-6-metoxy-1,4-benzoquinol methylase